MAFPAPCMFCGKPVDPSKSRNKEVKKDTCNRRCKDAAGTRDRKVGRRVVNAVPREDEREALISTIEQVKSKGRLVRVGPVREKVEMVDLGPMTSQERLGILCRAAERWGVMP